MVCEKLKECCFGFGSYKQAIRNSPSQIAEFDPWNNISWKHKRISKRKPVL